MRLLLAIVALLLAAAPVAGGAVAPDGGRLEEQLREQLDRMFEPKEYLLDVQMRPLPAQPGTGDLGPLPGLGYAGPPLGPVTDTGTSVYLTLGIDVLVVVDTTVSKERTHLADEVVRRVLAGLGTQAHTSLKVKQQQIAKPEPPKPEEPKPAPAKTLFDLIEENKDLLIRVAGILWAALVSLMGVYGMVRRFSAPPAGGAVPAGRGGASRDGGGEAGRALAGGESGGAPGRAKAPAKDELYSKDQAFLTQVNDIVGEARANPSKVAKVLTRWVGLSAENAHYAAIFLRNCDIKTIEAVSGLLHPADIEKIVRQTVDGFDAFSEENHKVLELMRSDLALLSAERMFRDRPDPLDFAKSLSEDDVVALVSGEPLDVVALIATQIPPHRMQKYYATLDAVALNALCAQLSTLKSPSLEDFKVIRDLLARKAESLGSALFDDRTRIQTLSQLLQVVSSPRKLGEVAASLAEVNRDVYAAVRLQVILPVDLNYLSQRASAVLTQAIDADVLGLALAGLGLDFARLAGTLPEAYREVFIDKLRQEPDPAQQDSAWDKVVETLHDLMASGLISDRELAAARSMADEASRNAHRQTGGDLAVA